jgi:hypothetical protein
VERGRRERERGREDKAEGMNGRDMCALEKSRGTRVLAAHVVVGPLASASFHKHEIGRPTMSRVSNQMADAFRAMWHVLL